jgi:hypothetical protein
VKSGKRASVWSLRVQSAALPTPASAATESPQNRNFSVINLPIL